MLVEDDSPEITRKVIVRNWGHAPGKAAHALRTHTNLPIAEAQILMISTNVVVAQGGYSDIAPLVAALCDAGAKLDIVLDYDDLGT